MTSVWPPRGGMPPWRLKITKAGPYSLAIRGCGARIAVHRAVVCAKKNLEVFRMTCRLHGGAESALARGMGRSHYSPAGNPTDAPPGKKKMGGSVDDSRAGLEIKWRAGEYSADGRRRLHITKFCPRISRKALGAGLRNSARPAGACAPRGGLCAPPDSPWLRHAPLEKPFTAETLNSPEDKRRDVDDSDILPGPIAGSTPDNWHAGMAKSYSPA